MEEDKELEESLFVGDGSQVVEEGSIIEVVYSIDRLRAEDTFEVACWSEVVGPTLVAVNEIMVLYFKFENLEDKVFLVIEDEQFLLDLLLLLTTAYYNLFLHHIMVYMFSHSLIYSSSDALAFDYDIFILDYFVD